MATPGELIGTVARALDVSEVTVGVYYRKLREAGLVTKGGRGRSAPRSTHLDATRLLIAILTSDTGKDAAAETERFGGLGLVYSGEGVELLGITDNEFDKLDFESALSRILSLISNPELNSFLKNADYPIHVSVQSDASAEIQFSGFEAFYGRPPRHLMQKPIIWPLARPLPMSKGIITLRLVEGSPLAQIAACIGTGMRAP